MQYLGDYKEDDTLHFLWHTAGADGASITRATNGTVSVYKDNGVAQSTAGITDTEDFDSLTGVHACTIDLSAHAFYAVGADYAVVLSAATIDGQVVNAVLAHFSIENRNPLDVALSGHQIQGTAGAAVTMAAYLGPHGPGVYIDDGAANTDTVLGEDGTLENPVSTIAAATTIATALGIKRFYLINNTSITLAQTYEDYEFVGIGLSNQVTLGSQDVDNSEFYNVTLTGTQGGSQFMYAFQCRLEAILSAEIIAQDCWLTGDVTMRAATNQSFDGCKSSVPGGGTPNLIFPGAGTTTVNFRHYSGGLTVKSATANDVMSYETDGQLVIDATCTSLTIHVRGNCLITDNGTTTALTRSAALTLEAVADQVWDEARADHEGAASFGRMLQALLSGTASSGGSNSINIGQTAQPFVNSIVQIVGGTGADQARIGVLAIGNSLFVSPDWATDPDNTSEFVILPVGAVSVMQYSQVALNALTDSILSRPISNVDGAGLRTLYGAIASLVNRAKINGNNLEIYETDDATLIASIPITTSGTQNPITELDPP